MGAASSGGSDNQVSGAEAVASQGKGLKVSTYGSRQITDVNQQIAEQNRKNQKSRASLFNRTIGARIASGITGSKLVQDNNYKRRVAFAKKTGKFKNTDLTSREFVLSSGFKTQLDALGYADSLRGPEGRPDRDDPPRVEVKNIGGRNVQVEAPTAAEVSQSESTSTEEYDPRKTKRRGRRMTILSKNLGNFTLSKPTLLGS